MKIRVGEASGPSECPLCRSDTEPGATEVCPDCGIGYHADCLVELGSCVTPGCDWRGADPAPLEEKAVRVASWPAAAATVLATLFMVVALWLEAEPDLAAPLGFTLWLVALYVFERIAHRRR